MHTAVPLPPVVSPDWLQRFDVCGPRYTSYPTADRFVEAYDGADHAQALAQRGLGLASVASPLSLYVHIPFCESLCYYCACNKIVTRHHSRAAGYLDDLSREAALVAAALGRMSSADGRGSPDGLMGVNGAAEEAGTTGLGGSGDARTVVTQLHLGGGTPTFLSDGELHALMALLRRYFVLVPGGEYSVEVDPRTVNAQRLQALAQLGFNRLSFGVQDFEPAVQKAVHRIQPVAEVAALVDAARSSGFESINLDLIYGLPRQTPASFARTLAQVAALRPDRIALYAYAHLPERFKPQRRIATHELPPAPHKLAMLSQALAMLGEAGYDYVGMDHFALPNDALSVAKRQGRLHRNFQGYSTQPDCDLIGLGVSAISRVGASYAQNAKTLQDYRDRLDQGRLPVVRGLALTRDDLVRRAVIMALMCQGQLLFETIELAWLLDFKRYFAAELGRLQGLQDDGLVEVDAAGIRVTPQGWYVVRAVAMVFDRYLQADRQRAGFSRII